MKQFLASLFCLALLAGPSLAHCGKCDAKPAAKSCCEQKAAKMDCCAKKMAKKDCCSKKSARKRRCRKMKNCYGQKMNRCKNKGWNRG